MTQNNNIARIIKGCKNADETSFEELVDMYSDRFYGYFFRLSGDRNIADDLLGELFVKLVQKIKSYRGGSFDCWLYRIASNVFNDHLRKKLRNKKLIEQVAKQNQPEPVAVKNTESDITDKLQAALSKIDPDLRQLIAMRFYSDLTFKEMADIRSEPIGTTLSKLHRGLKNLRSMME